VRRWLPPLASLPASQASLPAHQLAVSPRLLHCVTPRAALCQPYRVDAAAALDLSEVVQHGAGGCILAERLLPEVAYKLGRASKYGA